MKHLDKMIENLKYELEYLIDKFSRNDFLHDYSDDLGEEITEKTKILMHLKKLKGAK